MEKPIRYTVQVMDEGYRRLDDDKIEWELDGRRPVRVLAVIQTADSADMSEMIGMPEVHMLEMIGVPEVQVWIREADFEPQPFAIMIMPASTASRSGGIRAEAIPVYRDVTTRALQILTAANERITARCAAEQPAGP